MDEAATCDRVGLLRSGRLLACGTPAELTTDRASATGHIPTLEDVFIELATGGTV